MYLTWLDTNTWLIELGAKRILVDPWLMGTLVFGSLDWLFKGHRHQDRPIPENIDLILLSQGLEDHTHQPTLRQLDRTIPVVGSATAAKVVQELGYTNVKALAHGETYTLDQYVRIEATPGSRVGLNIVENGYLLREVETGLSLYYEPHGTHPSSLESVAPIDVVITPILDLELPLVGPIIKGNKSTLELAKLVQPQVILPTATPGDVIYEGFLLNLLRAVGNIEEFRSLLVQNHLSTQVIEPSPGKRMKLQLEQRTLAI
ncbi:MAG: MBL fold metallo-hydrolase [Chroococcidiopsidaceae cyanobacterium CP_BM_ER_R8_30]|nr:MBL fold metallo-hydrolase [Chroococcidiopsidaceae cyanobacterium CP_BM_ER_R8_30]